MTKYIFQSIFFIVLADLPTFKKRVAEGNAFDLHDFIAKYQALAAAHTV